MDDRPGEAISWRSLPNANILNEGSGRFRPVAGIRWPGQANLSDKLARATTLQRSWIDVRLERQNSDLLASMNNRARRQLQLQQTVDGLSVAAIAYYVIGRLSYPIKGIPGLHDVVALELAISGLVPFVLLAIRWTVPRIRRSHSDHGPPKDTI